MAIRVIVLESTADGRWRVLDEESGRTVLAETLGVALDVAAALVGGAGRLVLVTESNPAIARSSFRRAGDTTLLV